MLSDTVEYLDYQNMKVSLSRESDPQSILYDGLINKCISATFIRWNFIDGRS
mgnify:CR=1 FL=1